MLALPLERIPPNPITRFAPSPTGVLHLGHVVNAVWTWGLAQALGGRVLLRFEDHDRGRSRPEYESSILADLDWLGLEPDQPAGELFRQSDHPERYQTALISLRARARVYLCRCSRKAIAEANPGLRPDQEPRYPGTCRDLGLEPGRGRGVRIALPDEPISFDDIRLGSLTQVPARQSGDLLLRDPVGNWTYQHCVTVDDLLDQVNLVIRGEDILPSTGRQVMLARWLGRPTPPVFLHHPLILNQRGLKLSKRDGAGGLAELRARGWSRERILGEAAHRSGLSPRSVPLGPDELGGLFSR